ncbi:MAG: hypothetical protein IKO93_10545 [Lentisphaeria bacterium]|nr:hypothetical protein [Lentisphaeria bacterium]
MKKFFIAVLFFMVCVLFADIPQSITLESGNIRIRLDGRKCWNMNRIEWNNHLLGVDEKGAHYGIAYQPQDSRFFIGSGHGESGETEKLISLEIFADGEKNVPAENVIVKGSKIRTDKVSAITDLLVKTRIVIENDVIFETAEISAVKPVKINYLYFFMHPWTTRFDKFHAVFANGKKLDVTFRSDNRFPNRIFVPSAAWYDTRSGFGAATVIRNLKGKKAPRRFLWDRTNYRKDYLCDFAHSILEPGTVVVYECRTGFSKQPDNSKWTADAEKLFGKLENMRHRPGFSIK